MISFLAGHPWVQIDGVAPDKPLDSAVLSRLKHFSAMNKLKKMALRVRFLMPEIFVIMKKIYLSCIQLLDISEKFYTYDAVKSLWVFKTT